MQPAGLSSRNLPGTFIPTLSPGPETVPFRFSASHRNIALHSHTKPGSLYRRFLFLSLWFTRLSEIRVFSS